jgi:hypothetical protein
MGLDMYLSAKKYMSRYFDAADSEKINSINEVFGVEGDEDGDYGAQEVIFRVAYWRKANAIHDWFVRNCQDGRDECQEAHVTREQLQELIELCKQIIAKPKKAEELLPTRNGFFFGGTDYDDWYMGQLQYTVDRFEKILADPAFAKGVDFYYQSSW